MSRAMLLVVYSWLVVLSVAVTFVLWRQTVNTPAVIATPVVQATLPAHAKLESLEVGRLDVVEPDGKPRVIIASAKQFPGAIWKGKEYAHPGREKGGILFFNDDGSEAGGLIYANDPVKHTAGGTLTFDQHDQDQTLGLTYDEEDGRREAGLAVWDRPETSMEPVLLAFAEYEAAKTDVDRARLDAKLETTARETLGGPRRLYAGKQPDGSAGLWLYDKRGKPRLRVVVDGTGAPSLEFLDADGKVVARMPK